MRTRTDKKQKSCLFKEAIHSLPATPNFSKRKFQTYRCHFTIGIRILQLHGKAITTIHSSHDRIFWRDKYNSIRKKWYHSKNWFYSWFYSFLFKNYQQDSTNFAALTHVFLKLLELLCKLNEWAHFLIKNKN